MKILLIILVLLGVAVVALALLKKRGGDGGAAGPWPFYAKKPLTQPEQVLFYRLVNALPGHIVLAQVQLSRVLGVKKGFNFHEWNNRINRMSYDFVVCAPDATVLAAIELDDKTHESAARAAVDSKKARASAAAGVRLVRWNVKNLPDEAAIRAAVAPAPGSFEMESSKQEGPAEPGLELLQRTLTQTGETPPVGPTPAPLGTGRARRPGS